jgi:hypothetical protein
MVGQNFKLLLIIFFLETDERANDFSFIENCTKLAYITNSNFWNFYYITDLIMRKRLKTGTFSPDGSRLFGVFGCTSYKDYFISTGSSYSIKEQDFAHIRVSKIQSNFELKSKAIKLIDLGNM